MSFARQLFSILTTDAILEGLNLVVKSVIGTLVGPKVFGVIVLLQLVPQYTEKFFRIGVDEGSTYVAAKSDKAEVGVVFFNTAFLTFLFGVAAIALFFPLKGLYFQHVLKGDVSYGTLWALLSGIPPLFLFRGFMKNLLYLEDIRFLNILNFGIPLLGQLLVLASVYLFGPDLFYITASISAAFGLGSLVAGIRLSRKSQFFARIDWPLQRQLLIYGMKVYLPAVTQFLHFRLDVLLLGILRTPYEVGLYSLIASFSQILFKLPSTISALLYPKASRRNSAAESAILTGKTCRHFLMIQLIVIFPFWFVVENTIHFFMPAYEAALPAFRILVAAWGVIGFSQIIHYYFVAHGQPQTPLKVYLISLVINTFLNLLLIPSLNITGAALASLASYLVCSSALLALFIASSQLPFRAALLPKREDFTVYKSFLSSWIRAVS